MIYTLGKGTSIATELFQWQIKLNVASAVYYVISQRRFKCFIALSMNLQLTISMSATKHLVTNSATDSASLTLPATELWCTDALLGVNFMLLVVNSRLGCDHLGPKIGQSKKRFFYIHPANSWVVRMRRHVCCTWGMLDVKGG